MLDLEEAKKDYEVLQRRKLWKKRAKEQEKALKKSGKTLIGQSQYIILLTRAKQIIDRKNPEPLREDPSQLVSARVLYDIIKEELKPEWKKARNNIKKEEEIIRSYVDDLSIPLIKKDLRTLHSAILAILAWNYKVSESTIKRLRRVKTSPKK